VQLICAFLEQDTLIGPICIRLERRTRIIQCCAKFLGDYVQGLGADISHAGTVGSLSSDAARLAQLSSGRSRSDGNDGSGWRGRSSGFFQRGQLGGSGGGTEVRQPESCH
jgi:hypothetical protein